MDTVNCRSKKQRRRREQKQGKLKKINHEDNQPLAVKSNESPIAYIRNSILLMLKFTVLI